MGICIYSKKPFASANGEHILQNFLGARWKSGEIVDNDLQAEFGKTIDVELERGLQPIRNLFGTEGGRGEPGPTLKKIPVTTGEVIDLEPGGKPRLATPIVEVNPRGNGQYELKIQMGSIQQLGWALHILRQKLPGVKVDVGMIKNIAQLCKAPLPGQIKLSFTLGGRDYFRGLLKSCFNLLGVRNSAAALSFACDPVRAFIKDGTGTIEDFARWIPEPQKLTKPKMGVADHFIGIATVRGGIEGIAQLFGEIRHSIRIAENYEGANFSYGYIVNPFRDTTPAENREPSFNLSAIPSFCHQHTHPSEPIWASFRQGIGNLCELYFNLAERSLATEIINEVLLPHDGELLTEELVSSLRQRLEARFAERMAKS